MPKLRGPKNIDDRLRVRRRGRKGRKRYYADFRDYAAVGGGQEALIPAGAKTATSDEDEARALAKARLAELKQKICISRVEAPPRSTASDRLV